MAKAVKREVIVPSKWDIIPIHASDRSAFKDCRRRWGWSSPSKRNLVPRAAVHGVRIPLWFGSGYHYALEHYYTPGLKEDPVVTWTTWFDLQWEGGLVHKDDLKQFIDRDPQPVKDKPDIFRVRGLDELLPFPDPEQFAALKDLGQGMLRFYKEYAESNDNFTVISTEHDFSVPILDDEGGAFYAVDRREMPDDWEPDFELENNYGPLMIATKILGDPPGSGIFKQVHTRGRMDMIIQDNETGRYGIIDHKTTSSTDDDYFRGLELDEQCTSYLTFSELEAKLYDLPYKKMEYIIYQALLKGYPKPPTPLKNGLPSCNRQEETTTPALFEQYIDDNGLREIFNADEKMQNYYAWLLEKGDERYIVRTPVYRNQHQRTSAMKRLYYEAVDMLSDPKLYPNPSRSYTCLNCVFRAPCIAAEDGSDYQSMLADGYVENWDR